MLRFFHRLHRIAGLLFLVPVLLTAISGTVLTVFDWSAPPQLSGRASIVPVSESTLLELAFDDAWKRYGASARYLLRPPRRGGEVVVVVVSAPTWRGQLHYHPASGDFLGYVNHAHDPAHLLAELHGNLLLGDAGKVILLLSTMGCIVLSATGLYLWLSTVYRRRDLSLRRQHRYAGIWLALSILLAFSSGAYMVWRPLSAAVNYIANVDPVVPPKRFFPASSDSPSLRQIVDNADVEMPGGRIAYITIAAHGREAIRVRKRFDDDPHPNGLSSIWLDPATGNVIQSARWDELDLGSRLFAWVYPFHIGRLGGMPQRLLWILTGVGTVWLSCTGFCLWRQRRFAGKPSLPRSPVGPR
ncbi:MAG: PepSY domain-containing protein [Azonexus sp.]|nr:PepSY-associated TM helix domain-containing protein [Azonexus sp.]MCK6411896.1 PepSY domain-containing protein [Azonexus sp.]